MGRKRNTNRGSEPKYGSRCVSCKQSDAFCVCTANFGTSRLQLIKNIVVIANTSFSILYAIERCYRAAGESCRLFVVGEQRTTPDCPGHPRVRGVRERLLRIVRSAGDGLWFSRGGGERGGTRIGRGKEKERKRRRKYKGKRIEGKEKKIQEERKRRKRKENIKGKKKRERE